MRQIVAKDLMTPRVLSIHKQRTLRETAAFLIDEQISAAVVRDESEEPVGVVSVTDIVAAAAENGAKLESERSRPNYYLRTFDQRLDPEDLLRMSIQDEGASAEDIMNPKIYSVDVEATATEVAKTMLDSHIHRLLVTEDDRLVGVISTSDLLGLLVEEEG